MNLRYPFHYDPPSIAPKGASELAIQASCKMRVENCFDAIFAAVPNGTRATIAAGRKAKREGTRKGFPDAIILGLGKNKGMVAFPEFKAGSALSVEQYATLKTLAENGYRCGVFRSQDTLADKMVEWGFV